MHSSAWEGEAISYRFKLVWQRVIVNNKIQYDYNLVYFFTDYLIMTRNSNGEGVGGASDF